MPSNTATGEKSTQFEELMNGYSSYRIIRWEQEIAEARAQLARNMAMMRRHDITYQKYSELNNSELPRKKKRKHSTEEDAQQPKLARTPTPGSQAFLYPQPEPRTRPACSCSSCTGKQVVEGLRLTKAALHAFNALGAQTYDEPYDPHSRVRKWLKATGIWDNQPEAVSGTETVDYGNYLPPFSWQNWDQRRAP